MANCAIVGINWGDEGKGRMVDLLTEDYDVVVRFQGGGNAVRGGGDCPRPPDLARARSATARDDLARASCEEISTFQGKSARKSV